MVKNICNAGRFSRADSCQSGQISLIIKALGLHIGILMPVKGFLHVKEPIREVIWLPHG